MHLDGEINDITNEIIDIYSYCNLYAYTHDFDWKCILYVNNLLVINSFLSYLSKFVKVKEASEDSIYD